MEMKLLGQSIATERVIMDTSVEQGIDCEISLPEYCSDILRILKCQITPGVSSTNVSGDRLTISGNSNLRLFYADECTGAVRCFQQQIPFERVVDLPNNDCSSPYVQTDVKMEFCNCRAINQRRVDVHAAFSISAKVSCQEIDNLLVDCNGCGTQLQCKEIEAVNRIGATCRNFTVTEVFEINQGKPAIRNILNTSVTCCVREVKVIPNKILVKGEVKVKALYCCDSKEECVEIVESTIPTSQIIDLEGITDQNICCVDITMGAVDVIPKADLNGEYRMMELCGKLFIGIVAYEKQQVKLIRDAYSTDSNLLFEEKIGEIPALLANIDETILSKGTLDFGQIKISKIIDIYSGAYFCKYKVVSECVVLYGSVTVNVLYADESGETAYIERTVDFEFNTSIQVTEVSIDCRPKVVPLNLDYSIQGASAIEVRVEQRIQAVIISKAKEKFITSIKIDEEHLKTVSNSALTIYFATENETVWEIARKFNSTKEAIKEENDIAEDIIKKPLMLLIPGV